MIQMPHASPPWFGEAVSWILRLVSFFLIYLGGTRAGRRIARLEFRERLKQSWPEVLREAWYKGLGDEDLAKLARELEESKRRSFGYAVLVALYRLGGPNPPVPQDRASIEGILTFAEKLDKELYESTRAN